METLLFITGEKQKQPQCHQQVNEQNVSTQWNIPHQVLTAATTERDLANSKSENPVTEGHALCDAVFIENSQDEQIYTGSKYIG